MATYVNIKVPICQSTAAGSEINVGVEYEAASHYKKSDLRIFTPLCACDYISYLHVSRVHNIAFYIMNSCMYVCTQHAHHMSYTTGTQQD